MKEKKKKRKTTLQCHDCRVQKKECMVYAIHSSDKKKGNSGIKRILCQNCLAQYRLFYIAPQ